MGNLHFDDIIKVDHVDVDGKKYDKGRVVITIYYWSFELESCCLLLCAYINACNLYQKHREICSMSLSLCVSICLSSIPLFFVLYLMSNCRTKTSLLENALNGQVHMILSFPFKRRNVVNHMQIILLRSFVKMRSNSSL